MKQTKRKKIGVGIVGCGVIADFHANALTELSDKAEIIGITDVNSDAAEKFAKRHGLAVFKSLDEMLACPDISLVNICTPSGYHADAAVAAANAGKNIIVEKPMAITTEQLDAIQTACQANGVLLSSIAQSRFSPSVRKVKKAMEEGLLGKIVGSDIYMKFNRTQEYYDSGSWRGTKRLDGGGALMNQGIHGVDLLIYLAGDISRVFAFSKTLSRKIEVEDTLCASVEFKSGALGVIQATTSVFPGYPRRLEINGDKGSIILEETSIIRWDIDCGTSEDIVRQPAFGTVETVSSAPLSSASTPTAISVTGHMNQISDMIDAINNKRKPFLDLYEGRKAVDTILAIYRSAETGAVVEL